MYSKKLAYILMTLALGGCEGGTVPVDNTSSFPAAGVSSSSSVSSAVEASSSSLSVVVVDALVLQEEEQGFCFVEGSIDTDHQNYTGSGFGNTNNQTGSVIAWHVNANEAGTYKVMVRYSSGSGERPGIFEINESAQAPLQFANTQGWDDWGIVESNIPLMQGSNTVFLRAGSNLGLANIDSLTIDGNGLSAGNCSGIEIPVVEGGGPSAPQPAGPPTAIDPVRGDIGSHDPTRIIESNGKYFIYSTGRGIPMKWSYDKLNWTNGLSIYPDGLPSWVTEKVPNHDGRGVWAPGVFYMNGLYYMYYSVATWETDDKRCAIGLTTSPTLDPESPNYKWTDRGPVVTNEHRDSFSAIDAAPFFDAEGNPWLVWGSGYTVSWSTPTMMLTPLDKNTGMAVANPPQYELAPGHIEAGYIHYNDGYYYLFFNTGGCCNGADSSYTVHVQRSRDVKGPYLDKSGNKNGNNDKFMSSYGSVHGPGHIGILSEGGHDYFTYHYYPDQGGSVIGLGRIEWGNDGWPKPIND